MSTTVESQVEQDGQDLCVHLTCHAPEHVPYDRNATIHLLAPVTADPQLAESASVVVVAFYRHDGQESPRGMLHEAARRHPGARVAGVVTSRCTALVWVRVQPPSVREPVGYTVLVRSGKEGPAELFPSVIYGWLRWWSATQQSQAPPGYPIDLMLPRPPRRLDATVRWSAKHPGTRYRLEVTAGESPGSGPRDPEDPTEHR